MARRRPFSHPKWWALDNRKQVLNSAGRQEEGMLRQMARSSQIHSLDLVPSGPNQITNHPKNH